MQHDHIKKNWESRFCIIKYSRVRVRVFTKKKKVLECYFLCINKHILYVDRSESLCIINTKVQTITLNEFNSN